MTKSIIKEIAIVLLLLAVMILIFGIIFYDYIPTNKTVPAKVQAYQPSNEIQNELKDSLNTETQNIVKTYTIDSSDLSLYESTDNYDKGKRDPFYSYNTTATQTTNSTNTNASTTSNTTKTTTNTSSNTASSTTNTTSKNFYNTGKNQ
jgi:hypothetical protein